MAEHDLRQQLLQAAQALNSSGINQGTSGNVAARIPGGMLITPTYVGVISIPPGMRAATLPEVPWLIPLLFRAWAACNNCWRRSCSAITLSLRHREHADPPPGQHRPRAR